MDKVLCYEIKMIGVKVRGMYTEEKNFIVTQN